VYGNTTFTPCLDSYRVTFSLFAVLRLIAVEQSTPNPLVSAGKNSSHSFSCVLICLLPIMSFARRAGDDVNLVVYENIQPIVWITTIPFFLLGLVSSAIRLYTRAFVRKPFGTDDWFMLVGTVSFLVPTLNVANSAIDLVHRSTIHRLDVDHPRWRVVSLTPSSRQDFQQVC
jgi:hypothetical protein